MGVFLRILLRYVAAALVARGFLSHDVGDLVSTDPDLSQAIEIVAGGVGMAIAEGWYYLAKRLGWRT